MAFTASQMENTWQQLFATTDDGEYVSVLQSTTGEYYRLTLAGGKLYHWNRTTGTWDVTNSVPTNLIAVTTAGVV